MPAHLKERKSREEVNDYSLKTLYGTVKYTGLNIHSYDVANDSYRGLWLNICPEDFNNHWGLKNSQNIQKAYLQEVDFENRESNFDYDRVFKPLVGDITSEGLEEEGIRNYQNTAFNAIRNTATAVSLFLFGTLLI